MPIPRFNRRLLWIGLAALAWAYLGLLAALAQTNDGPPGAQGPGERRGLRLRLPQGAVHLPGWLAEVREERGRLTVVMAVRDLEAGQARGPDGELVRNLPPGVEVRFVKESEVEGYSGEGPPPRAQISTLQGQDRPLHLPGGKDVIVGERFYVSLVPGGVALIPHKGKGLELLRRELRRQMDDRLGERRERRGEGRGFFPRWRERREGDEGRPPQDGEGPPQDGQRPPRDGQRPPHEGQGPPPDGQGPPRDGQRPPHDGQGPPDGDQRPPDGGGKRPPPDGQGPPPDGKHPPGGGDKPRPPQDGGGDGHKPRPPQDGGGGERPRPPQDGGGGGGQPPRQPGPPPGGRR